MKKYEAPKHIFKVWSDTEQCWFRTARILSDEEFEQIMALMNWEMPLGMAAFHFQGDLHADTPNKNVFLSYQVLKFDVEELFSSSEISAEQIRYRKRDVSSNVIKRIGEYAITYDPDMQWIDLAIIDGKSFQLQGRLEIIPVTLRDARAFNEKHHRHCCAPHAHKFSVGLTLSGGNELFGVAVASTPKARLGYDKRTLEVNRVCVYPPIQNGCTKLYGAVIKIGKVMGYKKFITYTLSSEDASSVRAAGFRYAGKVSSGKWDRPGRHRDNQKYPDEPRERWIKEL